MDLTKIAENEEMTYLEKVAAIVDEFAAGNVTGEEADAIAQEAGIAPSDLLAVHDAAYAGMEKVAEEAEEAEEATETAAEEAEEEMEKTAADESMIELSKIANDESASYLTKCAGIADAFASGALTGEEGDALAVEMGLEPGDVASVFDAAYGEELEKDAGVKEFGGKVLNAVKDAASAKQFRAGVEGSKAAAKKTAAGEAAVNMGKQTGKSSHGKLAAKKLGEGKKMGEQATKDKIAGAAKTTALYGGGAATLFGAGRASKGDDK